ncbi:hypothetical protein DFA_05705 [Cavenderia fasciculata]|uniref:NmrA-like domain-containing protein n=1 Tax=Cavenderia fasciculata TaxID=261658 RepID=F4PM72_CACFS|nr:uncharacterized protein DFA_05705 [Cavenderia fasciculata]EGG23572.1 hypothetical protein DFA_05705 [Cavenderia fasciculata]|eukprot:XP_004361423.1 hypothetical protein DFA_05705 [Cavenderia fasciculata]
MSTNNNNNKKLFVVINSYSKQGISIINSLIQDGKWNIRGVSSRDSSTIALANEWKEKAAKNNVNIEFVQRDVTKDVSGLFDGADAAFLMTPNIDYADPDLPAKEIAFVTLQADEALKAKVQHVIFSSVDTLPHPEAIEPGFDILTCRPKVQAYIEKLAFPYVSVFLLAYFHSNTVEFIPPKQEVNATTGVTEFVFPFPYSIDSVQPYIDTYTATGPTVLAFLENPKLYNRNPIPLVSEWLTYRQVVETFENITGIKSRPVQLSRKEYLEWNGFNGNPVTELIGNRIFQVWESTITQRYYDPSHDPTTFITKIQPDALTWSTFLKTTQWKGESYQEFKEKNHY